MDLTTVALLSMFGAALGGGLAGFVVGRLSRFELGLSAGLLIFGGVTLGFAGRCYTEYQAFAHAGANGVWGEVIRIDQIPIGDSGTQPAPVVRFTAPDESVHTVVGPRASSAKVGEHVNVIVDAADPQRSRIGQITELRGCAIALMLFATFPLSFAVFMLYSAFIERMKPAATPSSHPTLPRRTDSSALRRGHGLDAAASPGGRPRVAMRFGSGIHATLSAVLHLTLIGAIVWIGMGSGDLGQRFSQGFGIVAAALAGYAILGLFGGKGSSAWSVGVIMLALNFAAWAWALHLLL